QWGIVDENDLTLYSTKMRSLLIYSAERMSNEEYPDEYWGYGKLDLYNVFNIIGGNYRKVEHKKQLYRNEEADIKATNNENELYPMFLTKRQTKEHYMKVTYNEFYLGKLFFRAPDDFSDIKYIKCRWRLLNNGE